MRVFRLEYLTIRSNLSILQKDAIEILNLWSHLHWILEHWSAIIYQWQILRNFLSHYYAKIYWEKSSRDSKVENSNSNRRLGGRYVWFLKQFKICWLKVRWILEINVISDKKFPRNIHRDIFNQTSFLKNPEELVRYTCHYENFKIRYWKENLNVKFCNLIRKFHW